MREDRQTLLWGQSPLSLQQLQVGSPWSTAHLVSRGVCIQQNIKLCTSKWQQHEYWQRGQWSEELAQLFCFFMVVVTSVCCNSKVPHQPAGSQPSCRLWRFPLRSPSGGRPCLPGAELLTVWLIPVHAQAVLALASSLVCRQPPSADPR